ncbi:MAG: amidohydrolase family protein [Desulfobacterales bacterium]|nr:amidohydrolase family protein [Desulfobacterales bacterium]
MAGNSPKIDIFTHILPEKYLQRLYQVVQKTQYLNEGEGRERLGNPALSDIEGRLRAIDEHQGLRQVLTINIPPIEEVARPGDAVQLACLANDELAELVARYPDHFAAGVACLPVNDMDAALKETRRAIEVLKLKGVQVYTSCTGKPLDDPVFFPLYETMTKYDLPIWLHPTRNGDIPEYRGESHSKYRLFQTLGWPYETSVAMGRMVFGGVLEKYPGLKIITHHCGGMVPFFAERLTGFTGESSAGGRQPIDDFKMFYGDTALSGGTRGLICGYDFFGADHIVFGTDMPYGESGRLGRMISFIEQWEIPAADKSRIFEGNARRLLHL